ncbi:YcjX family protein [Radicibacter daui]|uniref:YcjX family protein n=1 Tax=Radicibacter daui TaxID=3064829 RepID=UPI004046CB93
MFEALFDSAGRMAGDLMEGRIRLGVTGLSRSGKTVFITALVDHLLNPSRLPLLTARAEGRLHAALLRPQPDPQVPRFDYEAAHAAINGLSGTAGWPPGTTRLSELRLSLRYRPHALWRQWGSDAVLNLDIYDYPGEWLLDLPMLRQNFADWSAQAFHIMHGNQRRPLAAPFLEALQTVEAAEPASEAVAADLARRYTAYLFACRDSETPFSHLQPGRFLVPGEAEGAPMLTFAPLIPAAFDPGRGSLWRLMEERYEAYRARLVKPFFETVFSRLDAQIVLVDLLDHLKAGPASVRDLGLAITETLDCFRHGSNSFLSSLLGPLWRPRVEKLLFAATKADHLPRDMHAAYGGLLAAMVAEARRKADFNGAATAAMAIASVRATQEADVTRDGEVLRCVTGTPLGGGAPVAAFAGALPASLSEADLAAASAAGQFSSISFAPPPRAGLVAPGEPLPHLGLDRALQFLIGEALA